MQPLRLLLASAVLCIGFYGPTHAQGDAASSRDSLETEEDSSRPDFRLLRQNERWDTLAGEETGWSALKHRPLTQKQRAVLTIGGEARAYGRWYRNEQWGAGPSRDGYLLQRVMLHGSLRTGMGAGETHARVFAQLKSGLVAGRDGPIYPPDKDLLGVNQAFLSFKGAVGGGSTTLRVGRQELHYGAGRMIAVREGPNVRLGFDAVLGRTRHGPWRVDAFVAKPNDTPPGLLDNGWKEGRTLWGVYLRRQEGRGGRSLYYLGTRRNPSPANADLRATRHTIGGRGYGAVGGLKYDLEGALQIGRYNRRSASMPERGETAAKTGPIRAWTLAGRLSYRAAAVSGRPALGLLADVSSGNRGGTSAHETFAAPYPSGRFTGAGSRLGPGNLINVAPFVHLHVPGNVRLHLKSHLFWRASAADGLYAIWGAPLRSGAVTDARFVGAMPEAVLSVEAGRHLTLAVEASYFRAGPVLRASPNGRDLTHLGLRVGYVF